MRTTWVGFQLLTVGLLVLAGCKSSGPILKPTKHPEEYNLPPDENRFADPHAMYPKETLNKDKIKKDDDPKMDISGMKSTRVGGNPTGGGY